MFQNRFGHLDSHLQAKLSSEETHTVLNISCAVKRQDIVSLLRHPHSEQSAFSFTYLNERQIGPKGEDTKLFCRAASILISWKHSLLPTLMVWGYLHRETPAEGSLGVTSRALAMLPAQPPGCLREEKELLVVPLVATDMWLNNWMSSGCLKTAVMCAWGQCTNNQRSHRLFRQLNTGFCIQAGWDLMRHIKNWGISKNSPALWFNCKPSFKMPGLNQN